MSVQEAHEKENLRVAFAMQSDYLRAGLFNGNAMGRLSAITDVATSGVLTEFSSERSRKVLEGVDVLITGWGSPTIDSRVLDTAPRLKLIAHAAGSVKGHVSPACWERGLAVTSAAAANAVPVAEYTLAAILLAGKRAFTHAQTLRARPVPAHPDSLDPSLGNLGATVGIIGASRIGRLVLEYLRPFGLRLLLADPTLTAADAAALGAELVPLKQLMSESRVVSLHAPLLPGTVGMIGATELAAMPDGSTFINTARGILVEAQALRAEAASGRIHAVLDVTDPEPLPAGDPLYAMPNVFITPHMAGSMGNELHRMGDLITDEIHRFASGRPLKFDVTSQSLLAMA